MTPKPSVGHHLQQASRSRVRGVVAIDLDGTLLPDTTVSILLGAHFGDPTEVVELERAYAEGGVGHDVFAERSSRALRGVSLGEIADVLRPAAWLDGIRPAVASFHKAGLEVLLTSITWAFACRIVADDFGLDAACGSEMGVANGILDGKVVALCSPLDKAAFAVERCRVAGLTDEGLVAIGDSGGDLPLFAAAGLSVALNGTDEAVAAANVSVVARDLRDVVPIVLSYFSLPGATEGAPSRFG